jgi:UDP-N-acetylglucosamine 4,6-dehydratase/5-epimerase
MLNGKRILITGGTGSFGKKFVEVALKRYPNIKRLSSFQETNLSSMKCHFHIPMKSILS